MKKIILLIFVGIFLILNFNLLKSETKNIEYAINITYIPYCRDISCITSNVTYFDNSTNTTIVNRTQTNCSANCYGKIKLEGINENKLFVELDTGVFPWLNGSSDLRYGYKTADLGNLSDISGIRQSVENLSFVFDKFYICQDNLTNCVSLKSTAEANLLSKTNEVTQKDSEVKSKENERWLYGLIGIGIGLFIALVGIPYLRGRNIPRDGLERQLPNVPY